MPDVEISKFVKTGDELETELDKWLYLLKHISRMNKIPVYLKKPVFEKLFNIAEYTNLTREEKTMYDSSLKYKWDSKNVLNYALQESLEKGGLKKAMDIATEMKKDGIPINQIVY